MRQEKRLRADKSAVAVANAVGASCAAYVAETVELRCKLCPSRRQAMRTLQYPPFLTPFPPRPLLLTHTFPIALLAPSSVLTHMPKRRPHVSPAPIVVFSWTSLCPRHTFLPRIRVAAMCCTLGTATSTTTACVKHAAETGVEVAPGWEPRRVRRSVAHLDINIYIYLYYLHIYNIYLYYIHIYVYYIYMYMYIYLTTHLSIYQYTCNIYIYIYINLYLY